MIIGTEMTLLQAQHHIDNLVSQFSIGLCSRKEIDSFLSRIKVVFKFDSIERKNEHGFITRYELFDASDID